MGKFIIGRRSDADFQFNLKADNGLVILTSQGYSSKENCQNGIASVRKNSSEDSLYERSKSANDKHYFNLKSTNGQVIGTSQMYESSSSMETGIDSVKRNAPDAVLEED